MAIPNAPKQRILQRVEKIYYIMFDTSTTGSIRKKLGEWVLPIEPEQRWQAYVNLPTEEIFLPIADGVLKGYYKQLIASSKGTNSLSFMSNSIMRLSKNIPKSCIPADVYHHDTRRITKYHRGLNKPTERTIEYNQQNSEWEQIICENIMLKKAEAEIQ
jgi:hypothetical protein